MIINTESPNGQCEDNKRLECSALNEISILYPFDQDSENFSQERENIVRVRGVG